MKFFKFLRFLSLKTGEKANFRAFISDFNFINPKTVEDASKHWRLKPNLLDIKLRSCRRVEPIRMYRTRTLFLIFGRQKPILVFNYLCFKNGSNNSSRANFCIIKIIRKHVFLWKLLVQKRINSTSCPHCAFYAWECNFGI